MIAIQRGDKERAATLAPAIVTSRRVRFLLPVKRDFAAAGFETRIVHPFATKQFRQPANPVSGEASSLARDSNISTRGR